MRLNFRLWLEDKEAKQDRVRTLIDGQNLILFFTKNGNLFGCPEESRLVFAKMKKPDDDMPDNWADEANFGAFDLMKALMGDRVENIFGKKDLSSIKIIEPDDAHDMLMKYQGEIKPIRLSKHGTGMIKLKDRKRN